MAHLPARRHRNLLTAAPPSSSPSPRPDLIVAEFIHQAGYWLSVPGRSSLLAEVDALAEHSTFAVGLTIPGWFDRWFSRQKDPERALQAMLDAISEVHAVATDAEHERDEDLADGVISLASHRR